MRYSIDLDEETIKNIDMEAVQQHRSRKLQMESIIIEHFIKKPSRKNQKVNF